MSTACYVCNEPNDVRPYGKGGAWICFDCMKSDPVREAEAYKQFKLQFDAAEAVNGTVVIGEQTGPRPGPGGK